MALAGRALAQSAEQPSLIFSISPGITTGRSLWHVERQELFAGPLARDTIDIGRRIRSGFSMVLGATLFRSPHLGFALEGGLWGLGSEARCTPPATFTSDINRQACDNLQGKNIPTNAAGFQAGLVWRFAPGAVTQPYVRAAIGIAILGNSFVQTAGRVQLSSQRQALLFVFEEEDRLELTWTGSVAAGATVALAPGYQARFEIRDLAFVLPRVTGPAPLQLTSEVPIAPVRRTLIHVAALTAGIDIVLERRRARRY